MALWGLLALPVLVAAGLLVANVSADRAAQTTGSGATKTLARTPHGCASRGLEAVGCAVTSAASDVSVVHPPRASHRARHQPRARPKHSHRPPASASPTPAAPPVRPALSVPAASQVLALVNQARVRAGRPAYTLTSGLDRSAAAHTAVMVQGCGLSHQCPGEPALGDRETAAGVHWTAAGENIGEGGPVSATASAIAQMAVRLTQTMLNEKPPDDGHRVNILSGTFTHIGIAIKRDASGTVWLTQDFSN